MVVPLRESWDKIDNDFYTRAHGLRRYRTKNDLLYTEPSVSEQRLTMETSPNIRRYSSLGTPFGSVKRTVDKNNSVYLRGKPVSQSRWKDVGGPFLSEEIGVTKPTHVKFETPMYSSLYGHQHYANTYVHPTKDFSTWSNSILNGSLSFASGMHPSDATIMAHGTTGIARTIPTKPEMSLSTAIGELKDGIPSMIGSQLKRDRNLSSLGSEYLNYQFGIVPTVNDVTDVIRITKDYEKIIRQYRRDQGRVVRRRITLVDTEESTVTHDKSKVYAYSGGGKYPTQYSLAQPDGVEIRKSYKTKIWFSGAYAIAYPKDTDGLLQEISEFNRAYGVIPNAELAWNLLPWSWLVDWFSNLGDIMTNVSYLTSPNTRLSYGYVMAESSYRQTQTSYAGPTYSWTEAAYGTPFKVSSSLFWTRKRRLKASPFGFGVTFGSLTGKQSAILAALGLSRLRL